MVRKNTFWYDIATLSHGSSENDGACGHFLCDNYGLMTKMYSFMVFRGSYWYV